MGNRTTSLSFIIGLFFSIVALILLIGFVSGQALAEKINLYSGIIFLVFGIIMMVTSKEKKDTA